MLAALGILKEEKETVLTALALLGESLLPMSNFALTFAVEIVRS